MLLAAPLALALLASGPGVAADEAKILAYGRHLAQECTACHRLDGVDNGIPSIAGWDAENFAKTLRLYKDGVRTNPVMVSVAQSLDDDQVKALAAYWSSLPRPAKPSSKPRT